ncbi:MAG: DUF2157 domain-containing protein [Chitinophagales bacterium]
MNQPEQNSFLQSQIPLWLSKGWISNDTAQEILQYYESTEVTPSMSMPKNSINWGFIIMGILGATLIGSGIILIFAHNWDDFSRSTKTILCFLPLISAQIIYGYSFFKKSDSVAWIESTAIFLMLMLASCMALISQTYNLPGTIQDFLFVWCLLTIPLLYLSNATLVCVLYLCLISSWAMGAGRYGESIWYWGFLLAALPHLWKNLQVLQKGYATKNFVGFGDRARANLLGWTLVITFVIAIHNVFENRVALNWLLGDSIIFTFLYMLGKQFFGQEKSMWLRPFQTTAIAGIFVMSMFLTFKWHLSDIDFSKWIAGKNYPQFATWVNFAVLLIAVVALKALAIQFWQKGRQVNYLLLSFPTMVLVGIFIALSTNDFWVRALFNLYIFAWGLYYVNEGIKHQLVALVNAGTLFLATLLIVRFFDSDLDFLLKGIAFVVIGVGFLTANYVLTKRLKQVNSDE